MDNDLRFNVAEGFALLGLRPEAMEALKEVPQSPQERQVSELRLTLMTLSSKAWDAGEDLARRVQPGDPLKQRESAGRFWLGRAVSLCAGGDNHAGRQAVSQMVQIWPEGRQEALACEGLSRIW